MWRAATIRELMRALRNGHEVSEVSDTEVSRALCMLPFTAT
jgi:hypothetical protein